MARTKAREQEIAMKDLKRISLLFWIAAAYDGVLGVIFLIAPGMPFRVMEIPPPNHVGYVQFPAALLIVFALLFAAVARKPARNRNLIPYGIGLKVSYCSITFLYWIFSTLPFMWKPFAVFDLAFGVLFYMAFRALPQEPD